MRVVDTQVSNQSGLDHDKTYPVRVVDTQVSNQSGLDHDKTIQWEWLIHKYPIKAA